MEPNQDLNNGASEALGAGLGILVLLIMLGVSIFFIVIQILNWRRIKRMDSNLKKIAKKQDVDDYE